MRKIPKELVYAAGVFVGGNALSATLWLQDVGYWKVEPWLLPYIAKGVVAAYVFSALLLLHWVFLWAIDKWRGEPSFDLTLGAISLNVDYPEGAEAYGIRWEKGYSHAQLRVSNPSKQNYLDLDVVIAPEKPIIAGAVTSKFAACHFGLDGLPLKPFVFGKGEDGSRVPSLPQPEGDIHLGPPYRLLCEKLPPGATIEIDLATVELVYDMMAPHIWLQERRNPAYIDVVSTYTAGGKQQRTSDRLTFEVAGK